MCSEFGQKVVQFSFIMANSNGPRIMKYGILLNSNKLLGISSGSKSV